MSPQGHGLTGRDGDTAKLALRIEVEINRNDRQVWRYRHWAREIAVDPNFMKLMRRAAGPGGNDYDWYIYLGVIKPPFVSITDTASGGPVTTLPDDAPDMRGPGFKARVRSRCRGWDRSDIQSRITRSCELGAWHLGWGKAARDVAEPAARTCVFRRCSE
jgi:hypothetical protein